MRRVVLVAVFTFACSEECPCTRITSGDVSGRARPAYSSIVPPGNQRFAILGDTQRTSFQECVIGREVNDAETDVLLADLVQQAPAFVVVLGDMVFQGSSENHWRFFDDRMAAVVEAGLPVLPIMGNHEVHRRQRRSARSCTCTFRSARRRDLV